MEVIQLLGSQGFWQYRHSGELAARAAGNIVLSKGMATSISDTLQYSCLENPLTEKPGRAQSTESQRAGLY